METKAHYVFVGLFALLLVAAAGVFVVWLGDTGLRREYQTYEIFFDGPVRGLRNASAVHVNGIPAGEVTELGLDPLNPTRVIALIRVERNPTILNAMREDAYAQLEPLGLTGVSFIQITGGTPEMPQLARSPGQRYPRIPSKQAQLDNILNSGDTVLQTTEAALNRISRLFGDENLNAMAEILANLAALTEGLEARTALLDQAGEAVTEVGRAAGEIGAAAQALTRLADSLDGFVRTEAGGVTAEAKGALAEITLLAQDARAITETVRGPVEDFTQTGLNDLTAAAADLRQLTETLERLALNLEQNPASFLAGRSTLEVEIAQ
ncbi:MAG: MlaD family protein [Maricaulaceae bacterium]